MVASFLSPDDADRREAAFTRRLDRLSRQVPRMERVLGVTAETLALFVRFWLTITPPLPNDAQAAAQIKGRERCEGFVEALGRRLRKGQSFLREIPNHVPAFSDPSDGEHPMEQNIGSAAPLSRPHSRCACGIVCKRYRRTTGHARDDVGHDSPGSFANRFLVTNDDRRVVSGNAHALQDH